jgi:hypothetical protein
MLRNYFKSAIRYFVRHKGFSIINVTGLSIGLTVSLLMGPADLPANSKLPGPAQLFIHSGAQSPFGVNDMRCESIMAQYLPTGRCHCC